jgi:hypothetical protein
MLASGAVLGTIVAAPLVGAGMLPAWAWAPWLIAAVSIPALVLIGLRAARAPRWAYQAMARAPAFVCAKALTSHRLLGFQAHTWVRARRPGDPIGQAADR